MCDGLFGQIDKIEKILGINNIKTRSMFKKIGVFYNDEFFLFFTHEKDVLIRAQTEELFSYCMKDLGLEQVKTSRLNNVRTLSLFKLPKGWDKEERYRIALKRSFDERVVQSYFKNYRADMTENQTWDSSNVPPRKITRDLSNVNINSKKELTKLGAIEAFLRVIQKKKNLAKSRLYTYQAIIDGSYPFPLAKDKQLILDKSYQSKMKNHNRLTGQQST